MTDLEIYARFIILRHYVPSLTTTTQAHILRELHDGNLPFMAHDVANYLSPVHKPDNGAVCRALRRIGVQSKTIAQLTGLTPATVSHHVNKKATDAFTHKYVHELRRYVDQKRATNTIEI